VQVARLLDGLQVVECDLAVVACLQGCLRRAPAGRPTDVEGTHGQLGARFADRLGGHDADCLSEIHGAPSGQVTAVTPGADASFCLAGQHGPDLHPFDT